MPWQRRLQLQLNKLLLSAFEGRGAARIKDLHQDATFESAYEGQFVKFTKILVKYTSGGRIKWNLVLSSPTCIYSASIHNCRIRQETQHVKELPPKWTNLARSLTCLCPALVRCWGVVVRHHDHVRYRSHRRDQQLLVCGWCYQQASSFQNCIPCRSQCSTCHSRRVPPSVECQLQVLRRSNLDFDSQA